MIAPPERGPERDAAIRALLPHVAEHGWNLHTLTTAAGRDADLLFPGGVPDLVEAYCDLADRWMEQGAALHDWSDLRVPGRVRAAIALRLQQNAPYKQAVRRALGILAAPGQAMLAARCTGRTIDAIWHLAGDRSADFSWYTKRAILAGIYGATLLYWLRDDTDEDAETLAFLDRQLAGIRHVGALRRRIMAIMPGPRSAIT